MCCFRQLQSHINVHGIPWCLLKYKGHFCWLKLDIIPNITLKTQCLVLQSVILLVQDLWGGKMGILPCTPVYHERYLLKKGVETQENHLGIGGKENILIKHTVLRLNGSLMTYYLWTSGPKKYQRRFLVVLNHISHTLLLLN